MPKSPPHSRQQSSHLGCPTPRHAAATVLVLVLSCVFCAEVNASCTFTRRAIPVPDTVSPELQQLAQKNQNNSCIDVPTSLQDWRSLRPPVASGWLRETSDKFHVDVVARDVGGVHCYDVIPKSRRQASAKRLLLDLHRGGFLWGQGGAGALDAIILANLTGYEVLEIDYRLLPDHPFPAAIDDAMAVWNAIIKTTPPSNIGVYGSSAGGGLALSLVQRARDEGVALPGAVLSDSPWTDLSKTGDSRYTELDALTYDGLAAALAKLYADGRDLKDPKLSPVYGSFAKFPPTFLVSGVRDLFLSDAVRVNAKLRQAGVKTELVVQEGQGHDWLQSSIDVKAPEGVELYSQIAQFFDETLSNY